MEDACSVIRFGMGASIAEVLPIPFQLGRWVLSALTAFVSVRTVYLFLHSLFHGWSATPFLV